MRDGFIIETHEGEEIAFIACTRDGRMRERVERGLELKVDPERFTFRDTRDSDPSRLAAQDDPRGDADR